MEKKRGGGGESVKKEEGAINLLEGPAPSVRWSTGLSRKSLENACKEGAETVDLKLFCVLRYVNVESGEKKGVPEVYS